MMWSRDLVNIAIFFASAWMFGASLSCPDNITHKSSKNSNDQSGLPRPSREISNDNNLAREFSRNNNLASGKSITSHNRRLNMDKETEIVEKPVNGWIPYRHFTTHFANYFTNKENRAKQGFSHQLQRSKTSETNKKRGISSNFDLKSGQISRKFTGEIDEFPTDSKHISRNDKLTVRNSKSNLLKRNAMQRMKRKRIKKRKESLRLSKTEHSHTAKPNHRRRREADVSNLKDSTTTQTTELQEVKMQPNFQTNIKINNSQQIREVKIATVLAFDDRHPFSIKRVRPAIEIAIDKMNPVIAHHNRKLTVRFRDSKCDIADGINECINFFVRKEMHVLFGPCCDYSVAPCARQVVYWNIPMVTPGGLAGDFGLDKYNMYSTMTRVGSNFNTLVQFFIDVLDFYDWKKLKLVYNPYGQTNISSKFCHVAANDIHYGLRVLHQSKNISQTYVKFEYPETVPSNFEHEFGKDCAV